VTNNSAPSYIRTGRFTETAGFLGSIAGLKTFSRPLWGDQASCLFEQDQSHVGVPASAPWRLRSGPRSQYLSVIAGLQVAFVEILLHEVSDASCCAVA
jgi:hypothetical protein